MTGLAKRNTYIKFGADLIVYFGCSIMEITSNSRTCHFKATKIENELALSRIGVDFLSRIHLVCCNSAVLLCGLLRGFFCVAQVDVTHFAKLDITICSFMHMPGLGQNKDKNEPQHIRKRIVLAKEDSLLNLYKKSIKCQFSNIFDTALTRLKVILKVLFL